MKLRPTSFVKTPIALGIAALLSTTGATAAEFDVGNFTVNIDSTVTVGTSIRVEDRDTNLIGHPNLPVFDWTGYTALGNVIYPSADVWALADAAYSTNGDLGNLMNDPGDAFSTQFSGSHEIDIK